jgi:tripartite-type tricarboxylate transporter receptor subunit TctC
VNPAVPAKTFPEFIAYAKANPGKINMGSAGSGTPQQTIGEMFKMMTGVDMVHVPYHGSAPELADLIAGHVQVAFEPIQSTVGYIKSGMLRPLAVTTAKRSDAFPDLPTVGEFIPGFEARTWQGLGAPSAVPAEIAGLLNSEVVAALADPALKARLAELGIAPMPMTPAECQAFIAAEVAKWAKVIKFASIKPE